MPPQPADELHRAHREPLKGPHEQRQLRVVFGKALMLLLQSLRAEDYQDYSLSLVLRFARSAPPAGGTGHRGLNSRQSRSNSGVSPEACGPPNTMKMSPRPAPGLMGAVISTHFSQPSVGFTSAFARTLPSAAPARISMVPPVPPHATRKVTVPQVARFSPVNFTLSPLCFARTALLPLALP